MQAGLPPAQRLQDVTVRRIYGKPDPEMGISCKGHLLQRAGEECGNRLICALASRYGDSGKATFRLSLCTYNQQSIPSQREPLPGTRKGKNSNTSSLKTGRPTGLRTSSQKAKPSLSPKETTFSHSLIPPGDYNNSRHLEGVTLIHRAPMPTLL